MAKTKDTPEGEFMYCPLEDIRTNPVALREAQSDEEQFKEMVQDIKRRGILLPLVVKRKHDEATGEDYLVIIDGLQRYSCAQVLGLKTVPVHIMDVNDADIIATQIAANLIKVDTKPVEFTRALQQMMNDNPTWTAKDLADQVSKSTTWVFQRLSLLKLEESIQKLVDEGEIQIANAVALSKMPKEHQLEWLDPAMSQTPTEFVPACSDRVKELRAAIREGRKAKSVEFEPRARLRKMSELQDELESGEAGAEICKSVKKVVDGFAAGVKWALQLDNASIEQAKAQFEATRREREENRKKAAALKAEQQAQRAAEKRAEALEASGMTEEEVKAALARQQEEAQDAEPASTEA